LQFEAQKCWNSQPSEKQHYIDVVGVFRPIRFKINFYLFSQGGEWNEECCW
jgi:hypothetical protein